MSKFDLLINIIKILEEYEKSNIKEQNLKNFAYYLSNKVSENVSFSSTPDFSKKENHHPENFMEVEFSKLLTSLSRFAKHYVKKAFEDRSFKSVDEFSFLATLVREKSLLKSELINRHLMEISSGSEIIKRLIQNNLIQEFKDKEDKRAKRVSLTDKGYKEITESFKEMYKVAQIVKGDLNEEEMKQTIMLLKRLDFYHWSIHVNDKETKLNALHKKYVKGED